MICVTLFEETADRFGHDILALEIADNYGHLFVRTTPKHNPADDCLDQTHVAAPTSGSRRRDRNHQNVRIRLRAGEHDGVMCLTYSSGRPPVGVPSLPLVAHSLLNSVRAVRTTTSSSRPSPKSRSVSTAISGSEMSSGMRFQRAKWAIHYPNNWHRSCCSACPLPFL